MPVQPRSLRVVSTIVVAALLLALLPFLTAPALAADASVVATGLDRLVVGSPGPVTITVTAPSGTTPTTPLRIVGTFAGDEAAPTVAAVVADGLDPLEVDALGRFVVPAEDQPPLTLAANPELATGLRVPLQVTLPDGAERELSLVLARSNEGFATLDRVAGADRFETAALLSAATFAPGVEIAHVARADAFADALAAGPGAGLGANPVVLTRTDELPASTRAELTRLQPGRIVVLGGPVAIADAVVDDLADFTDGTVTRLSGADRYATAVAVANDAFPAPRSTVVVASGENFPDALAGGAYAATIDAPVLPVRRDEVPAVTAAAIGGFAAEEIIVLGGPVAISDDTLAVLDDLATGGARRLFGDTRYETAAAITAAGFAPGSTRTIYIATGENFPDALTGVPPAVLDGAPLLLVRRGEIPTAVAEEIARLAPSRIVVLGGEQVVGPDVIAALTLLTRDRAPSRDEFTAVATTIVPVRSLVAPTIVAPTAAMPSVLRPGDRTAMTVSLAEPGDVVASLVDDDGEMVALANPTATAALPAGTSTLAFNAPLDSGTYDVRVDVTTDAGTVFATAADALTVGITFPPPLISGLIEGVDDQSQLLAVRPAGGLEEGTVLTITMSSAEQEGVDYPLDGDVTVLNGNGEAELLVARDGTAVVTYVAGAGDRVPGDDPAAHPLLTMRVDGIDVDADAAATHVGSFFRDDIMHGVSRTFTVGAGSDVARPEITSLQRGSGHTFQTIRFGLPAPLEAGGTVTFDLGDAERTAVDYADAFAFLNGGGHGHEEGPGIAADVAFDVTPDASALLTVTALEDGIPAVNGEGPFVELFIGGIVVDDVDADPQVVVSRSGGTLPLTMTFNVGFVGLGNPTASDLLADTADQDLVISVELVGSMAEFSGLEMFLPPLGSGTDVTGATVAVTGGSGEAELYQFDDGFQRATYLSYFSGGDADGATLEFTLSGVDTIDGDHTSRVTMYRYDTGSEVSTTFDVGAGAALIDPLVSDLATNESDQFQFAIFAPKEALAAGETVTVDLTAAEAGGVSYGGATVDTFGFEGNTSASFVVEDGVSAVLVVTAEEGGIPAGSPIYAQFDRVSTDDVQERVVTTFTRQGAPPTTSSFRVRIIPGLRNLTATDLAAGSLGQTQTFTFATVGDMEPFTGLSIDLSGAERGGAAYGGALPVVLSGNGQAELYAFSGEYAEIAFRPNEGGLADGSTVEIALVGVNTTAVDETHQVYAYRYDSFRDTRTTFDIGSGSPFIGEPYVDSLLVGDEPQFQYVAVELAAPLADGAQVTIDLTAAVAGGVDYSSADVQTYDGGAAALSVVDGRTVVTYTAGDGGGSYLEVYVDGVVADTTGGPYEVTFTDVTSGRTARTSFAVFEDFGHGHGG